MKAWNEMHIKGPDSMRERYSGEDEQLVIGSFKEKGSWKVF